MAYEKTLEALKETLIEKALIADQDLQNGHGLFDFTEDIDGLTITGYCKYSVIADDSDKCDVSITITDVEAHDDDGETVNDFPNKVEF